ncbi:MAG: hypothetical protein ACK5MQ_09450 [Pikeienuella sp.]
MTALRERLTPGAGDWLNGSWAGRIVRACRESRPFAVAGLLSAAWLGGVLAYAAGFFGLFENALVAPPRATALEIALFALAALAPIVLFVFGALVMRQAMEMREEARRFADALEAISEGRIAVLPRPEPGPRGPDPTSAAQAETRDALKALRAKLAAQEAVLKDLRDAIARIETRETAPRREPLARQESPARREEKTTARPAAPRDRAQPALPLTPSPEAHSPEGVRWASVARALDFPRDQNDRTGFAALRETLKEREFAELLQAAEDVLTLLASDGLYMEDLAPGPAALEDWIAYAGGARGGDVAAVGGIVDEDALAKLQTRMRGDVIFRDSALHFLRRFDRLMGRMVRELGPDPLILDAANSRTGRAFMLIARVTGAFD